MSKELELKIKEEYNAYTLEKNNLIPCHYNPIRDYYVFKKRDLRYVFKKQENDNFKLMYIWEKFEGMK